MVDFLKSGGHPKGAAAWFAGMAILVIGVATALRFYDLFSLPLTNDETSALMRLNANSVSELLGTVVWNDGHPLLVQVFLWYWTKWFGTSIWVVKLPFLLCGLGSVFLMIRIGNRLGDAWAGLMAAAMLASLQFPVMYSEIARPYAPGLLLSLWAFHIWLRWLEVCKSDHPGIDIWLKPFIFMSVAGYLGASNHYFNALILLLLFVSGLWILPRKRWLRFLWPWWLMMALYVHQMGFFLHHLQVGSPGWLQPPTLKSLFKHFMYCFGYSYWPILIWLLGALLGEIMRKRQWRWLGYDEKCAKENDKSVGEDPFLDQKKSIANKQIRHVLWFLYLAPLIVAYFYSIYRAPVFQDSVLLFSWGFGLLVFALWVSRRVLSLKLKVGLILLTLSVNLYVLLVDRQHRELFNHQSYDGAVRTLKTWRVTEEITAGDAIWVYGFEPFFMEYHAKELGWSLTKWKNRGGDLQYFRDESLDYDVFRKRVKAVSGDDFYYLNMVGMDPMLRVWIQQEFPVLRREWMGPGCQMMHFSRANAMKSAAGVQVQSINPLYQGLLRLKGNLDSTQYREVLRISMDSLSENQFDAEFVANAMLEMDTVLLRHDKIGLVVMVKNGAGETVRYLDQSLGKMAYSVRDVVLLEGGRCSLNLYLAGRLVDVEWWGMDRWALPKLLNHCARSGGFSMEVFIDNADQKPIALKLLRVDFWPGNRTVYGLVNPTIP